ncbi:MAG TPA: hypothetical protein VND93_19965 [Myxococcales bacterium]|jgi:hypothetical protein|nr:hypothetical protein [Myxococcales bacterium]
MKKTIAPNEPGLPRTAQLHQGQRRARPHAERSDESLLSEDALAADEYGEGLTGIPPLEPEPTPQDILPDQVYRRGEEPDEEGLTARPTEPPHPIPSEELPEG